MQCDMQYDALVRANRFRNWGANLSDGARWLQIHCMRRCTVFPLWPVAMSIISRFLWVGRHGLGHGLKAPLIYWGVANALNFSVKVNEPLDAKSQEKVESSKTRCCKSPKCILSPFYINMRAFAWTPRRLWSWLTSLLQRSFQHLLHLFLVFKVVTVCNREW